MVFILLLMATLPLAFNVSHVKAEPKTWIVDDDGPADFKTIQGAINAASDGDTIFVSSGTYCENIVVNKSVSLIGENRDTTIIDGMQEDDVLSITKNNVHITNFTIMRSDPDNRHGILLRGVSECRISQNKFIDNCNGIGLFESTSNVILRNHVKNSINNGIGVWQSTSNIILENTITNNAEGIFLSGPSNYNSIFRNYIEGNWVSGIGLRWCASNNNISGNYLVNNHYGIWFREHDCSNNFAFHNNIINNTIQAYVEYTMNTWDNGYPSGGNYWSDYNGTDLYGGQHQNETGSDGIGDTPYVIDENNTDRYPLINPWGANAPIASFSWTPIIPEVGELVTFNASASMSIGSEIVSYEWNFGDGIYATGKIATHAYDFPGNFTVTLNVTDSEGLWDIEQKQIEVRAFPPSLTVFIDPVSALILLGETVTFTSAVSGGYPPYSYQWYLNGNPVSGATSDTWTFTPTTSGIYYVYLKVTDAEDNTAQSDTARVEVATVPVGGYSYLINKYTLSTPIATHIALIAIITVIFITTKRKTKKKR